MAVQFFASCLVELLRPDVGAAARRVLRAAGHDPRPVRGATCCGQPAYNAGYGAEARRVARRTLRALGDGDAACVVASGSCATMMSHHWPELFEGTADAAAARRAAARTVELTAFLTATAPTGGGEAGPQPPETCDGAATGRADPDSANPDHHPTETSTHPQPANPDHNPTGTSTHPQPANPNNNPTGTSADTGAAEPRPADAVVVHDSCHSLRELGVGATVRRALSDSGHIPVSADGAERCCGFGGSFSVKLPAVSVAMADEKLDSFVATGCEQVTSCDLSCLLHLQGRARRRGLGLRFDHVATLLSRET